MAKNSAVPERDPFIEAIAKRVVDHMCEVAGVQRLAAVLCTDRAGEPAAFVREDQNPPSTQPGLGHNRGPPLVEESAVFDVAGFCRWAKISRSTLYSAWQSGVGPRSFKIGTATRISRQSAIQWLAEREAAAGAEGRQLETDARRDAERLGYGSLGRGMWPSRGDRQLPDADRSRASKAAAPDAKADQ